MHGDDLIELILGHLAHRRVAGDPGFVDHDVQAAEPLDGGTHQSIDLAARRDVAPHRQGGVFSSELFGGGLGGAEIQIAQPDAGALGDEPLRDGEPQALRTARDDGRLAAQQRHLITPLRWSGPDQGPVNPTSYFIYDFSSPLAHSPQRSAMSTEVSDDDFQEILAQTRHFVRTVVVPREQEILAEDRVPDDLREQAEKMGLFGYAIPQEWGGLGLNLAQDVELAMELGYTSLALRSMFGTNNGIAGQVLVGFGTDEQKARWLEPMATGEVVASFALTEPGAGSNPSGLRTKAVRDQEGADWVING